MLNRCLGLGAAVALLALGAPGCGDGGSVEEQLDVTGGQTGDDGGSSVAECEVAGTTPLAFEELSPLGFAASMAAPLVDGEHVLPLEWLSLAWVTPDGDSLALPYGPESGADELRLELELHEQSARFVDLEDPRAPGYCSDRVDVDVDVRVETGSGAFQEHFASTVRMFSTDHVHLEQSLPLAALSGSFAFDAGALGELVSAEFLVFSEFTRYGVAGWVNARLERTDDPEESSANDRGQVQELAVWPSHSACSYGGAGWLPMLDTTERPSKDDLLQTVRASNPMGIFVDGVVTAPLALEVSTTDPWGCFSTAEAPGLGPYWSVRAELRLTSDALPGSPALPVVLTGETPLWSTQFGVSLSLLGPCADAGTYSVAEFELNCGDWGFDLSGYDAAHLVLWDSSFTEDGGYANVVIVGEKLHGCTWSTEGPICPDHFDWIHEQVEVGTLNFASLNYE